jgi:glycosyltransferase involved in cell wall biosynthesis
MAVLDPVDLDPRRSGATRPLRLLWLIDSLTLGGAESLTVAFARAARERSIELTVCARTTIEGNPLEDEIRAAGGVVENLGARNLRDVRAFRRLLGIVREGRIDIIHAHLTYAAIWAGVASLVTRVPSIATMHVAPPKDAGFREAARQWIMRRVVNHHAARAVVVSDALRQEFASAGIRRSKLVVVHNGVDVRTSSSDTRRIRRELGVDEVALLLTAVAVLREGKGIDVLLRAVARIADAFPSMRVVIAGEGPKREEWEQLARILGIDGRVIWTGFRRDIDDLLEASDLFIHPTLADAFPTVVLEAMAAGLPVIASRVGGVPEIVDDGVTGKLVPPGNDEALAVAIEEALRTSSWRRDAGAAARERAQREFSIEAWIERLERLYADVRAESTRGGA